MFWRWKKIYTIWSYDQYWLLESQKTEKIAKRFTWVPFWNNRLHVLTYNIIYWSYNAVISSKFIALIGQHVLTKCWPSVDLWKVWHLSFKMTCRPLLYDVLFRIYTRKKSVDFSRIIWVRKNIAIFKKS